MTWSSSSTVRVVMTIVLWTVCAIIVNVPLISSQEQIVKDETWSDYESFQKQHSLPRQYWAYGGLISNWDFLGSTVFTKEQVRLTPDVKSKFGAIWNVVRVEMLDWEVLIHLKIHGRGTTLAGDGLAFWYVKDRMETGPVFGSKDFFMGLGVMVDTYENLNLEHEFPYISIMVNNGSLHYDHGGDGTLTQIGGCEATKLRNSNYDTILLVRYEKNVLTVMTDFVGTNMWTVCAVIDGVMLPTKYYFGLTAATGDLSDNHDIISVHTKEILREGGGDRQMELDTRPFIMPSALHSETTLDKTKGKKKKNTGGAWWSWIGWIFWYLGLILLIGGLGVVGLKVYRHYNRQSRKHFY